MKVSIICCAPFFYVLYVMLFVTFENPQWKKVEQMQMKVWIVMTCSSSNFVMFLRQVKTMQMQMKVWLVMTCSGTPFLYVLYVMLFVTFENPQWRKVKQQCNYASSQAGNLRRHLKTHIGEKSKKCSQCNYTSSYASALRTHLKTHSGEKSFNAPNLTLHPLWHSLWRLV